MQTLIRQMNANCARIREIAETCEREQRSRNDAEEAEFLTLQRNNQWLEMQLAAARGNQPTVGRRSLTAQVRSGLNSNRRMEFVQRRDEEVNGGDSTPEAPALVYTGVEDVQEGGAEPIRIADVIRPLYEGLILSAVGIDMRTGLSGEYVWPVVEAASVKVAGEAVPLTKQKLNLDKVKARPERLGAAMSLTRQSIIQSDGLVEALATQLLPEAMAAAINKIMFSITKVLDTTDNLKGPFVGKTAITLPASPKYIDFCKMKAVVLKSGVPGTRMAWVMTKSTAAILEGTPRDAGSGIMLIEDGKLCGLPVFTCEAIGDGNIGLGDWLYQVLGLFGDISFIVDPYIGGDADLVNFYLNANYGTATLRPEAFALGKISNS